MKASCILPFRQDYFMSCTIFSVPLFALLRVYHSCVLVMHLNAVLNVCIMQYIGSLKCIVPVNIHICRHSQCLEDILTECQADPIRNRLDK